MDTGKTLRLPERPRADHPSNRFTDLQVKALIVGFTPTVGEALRCRECGWPGSIARLCRVCVALLEAHEDMRNRQYWLNVAAEERAAAKRQRRP